VGGIPEQIVDAETGFLVPVSDVGALATRVVQLLSDEPLRQRMGRLAVENARQRFSLDRQISRYLEWYADLAGMHASVSPGD
jgi:trehalose synthase